MLSKFIYFYSKVVIGVEGYEEILDNNSSVLHPDQNGIQAYWYGVDAESGIIAYQVAVGTSPLASDITSGWLNMGEKESGYIDGLRLNVTEETGDYYWLSVRATNGAGVMSSPMSSKKIKVLKENVPGQVYDGRLAYVDSVYQKDLTSISITFKGFDSVACGIVSYEWAIGSKSGYSDVLPYTSDGVVMRNATHAVAQVNMELESKQYFADVRAKTGHACHADYIVSSSDGIVIDHTQPTTWLTRYGEHANPQSDKVLYQISADILELRWNASDSQTGIKNSRWMIGTLPGLNDFSPGNTTTDRFIQFGDVRLVDGQTTFVTIKSTDEADNTGVYHSAPLTVDQSFPVVQGLSCNNVLSKKMLVLKCAWSYSVDNESAIAYNEIGIGTDPEKDDVLPFQRLPFYKLTFEHNMVDITLMSNQT